MHVHIISRDTARRLGMDRYFLGTPCTQGHIEERQTKDTKCLGCKRDKDRRYYQKNKYRVMDRVRRWREKNPEAARKNWEAWYFKDVDRTRMMARNTAHRRRERERGGGGMLRTEMTDWALGQDKVCFYCETDCEDEYQLDHLHPISKGGEHKEGNLVISCPSCNRKKGPKDPMEFIEEILSDEQ